MTYLAKMTIGCGGSWAKGETEEEAIKRCIEYAKVDWSFLYKIEGEVELAIFKDGGADSFEDDTFIHLAKAVA
jgi:hypothetical protein